MSQLLIVFSVSYRLQKAFLQVDSEVYKLAVVKPDEAYLQTDYFAKF